MRVQPRTATLAPPRAASSSGEQSTPPRRRISPHPPAMASSRGSPSSSGGSKRRREQTLEEAWIAHCRHSAAGSRRGTWRYVHAGSPVPPSLVDYAVGGRYFQVDPPPKPMSGGAFGAWRCRWEMEREWKREWEARCGGMAETSAAGSSSSGMAATAEEEEEEEEDPAFLAAVELSKKDAEAKERAEAEERAQAIAAVEALKASEAAGVIVLRRGFFCIV